MNKKPVVDERLVVNADKLEMWGACTAQKEMFEEIFGFEAIVTRELLLNVAENTELSIGFWFFNAFSDESNLPQYFDANEVLCHKLRNELAELDLKNGMSRDEYENEAKKLRTEDRIKWAILMADTVGLNNSGKTRKEG